MAKGSFLTSILLILCFLTASSQVKDQASVSICVIADNYQADKDLEYKALIAFLEKNYPAQVSEMAPKEILSGASLAGRSILWIYKNDTLPVENSYPAKTLSIIKTYITGGGNVILANQSMMLLPFLGLEKQSPVTRMKPSKDEGYGRQLGYHAFLSHPLFDGMNGGAYVLKPIKDTLIMQTGYFGEDDHLKGKIIAVDWDYIFLRENSKMITEYDKGKGKVLAIGGYLLYSLPNRNNLHLERFTRNIVNYLSGNISNTNAHYWRQGPSKAIQTKFTLGSPEIIQKPAIEPAKSKLTIGPAPSIGNYWDLAGERMLLMGTDSGGVTEIWAHPCLTVRDLKVSYALKVEDSGMRSLAMLKPEVRVLPSSYERNYLLDGDTSGAALMERLTVSPDSPIAVIHYEYPGKDAVALQFDFTMLFRLMWPYSEKVLGNLLYSWNESLNAVIATDASGQYVTVIGIDGPDLLPVSFSTQKQKEGDTYLSSIAHKRCSIQLDINGPVIFNLVIASSSEGLEKTAACYANALTGGPDPSAGPAQYADSVLSNSLTIRGADPVFNQGYLWALLATERFQVNTPGLGSSLTAGYATSDNGWDGEHAVSGRPGYGWYFGRDGEWSGFALLDYGDYENVRLMLSTFQRYQDLSGKIFHEMSTSGIVHYDAADATPLYVVLAGRYLQHSGDSAFIRRSWQNIQKAMDFCYSTDTDGDKLIENTNVGHGWVEGGHLFGSHTSLHLASCWAAALDAAAYMAGTLGKRDLAARYRQDAIYVKANISLKFWNPAMDYYYHGLMPDGSYMDNMSIMPAIPMLFGQSDPKQAAKVLPVLASNAFTTDWGCRIVPQNDPHYNPRGYHSGSVWPLFTGWAALAEFRHNNYLQAYSHLFSNLMIWQFWGLGFNEEVLNGDTFTPGGVCHHQCWSETMALQPAIEGMLGFQPDALAQKLTLKPWFPADWDTVEVRNIRVGQERVSMEAGRQGGVEAWRHGGRDAGFVTSYKLAKDSPGRLDVHFQPVLPPGAQVEKIQVNGQPAREWDVKSTEQGWLVADLGFWLDKFAVVEVTWRGGVTALPIITHPQPGEASKGFRILGTSASDSTYTVTLQGPRASRQEFRIWAANPQQISVEGAEITRSEGNVLTLITEFADLETDYTVKEVVIRWF